MRPFTPAEQAANQGITQVAEGADPEWLRAAMAAVRAVAGKLSEFTTDEVWDELRKMGHLGPHEPRAMGAVMKMASVAGLCSSTPVTRKSLRVRCHARPLRVWKSHCVPGITQAHGVDGARA